MQRPSYAQDGASSTHSSTALLEFLCPIPDPFDTFEGWERYASRDLERMTKPEIQLERRRVADRLRLDPDPDGWLLHRLARIDEELRRAD